MEMGEDSVSLGTELSADTLQALLEFDRKQGAVHLGRVSDLLLQQEEVAQEMPVEDWVIFIYLSINLLYKYSYILK